MDDDGLEAHGVKKAPALNIVDASAHALEREERRAARLGRDRSLQEAGLDVWDRVRAAQHAAPWR